MSSYECRILQSLCPHLFSSVTPQLITHWSQLCSSSPPRHYISMIQEAGAFLKVVFSMKGRKQSALHRSTCFKQTALQSSSCWGKGCSVQLSIKRVFAPLFLAFFFLGMRTVVSGWHLNAPHEVISQQMCRFSDVTTKCHSHSHQMSCIGLILHVSVCSWVRLCGWV